MRTGLEMLLYATVKKRVQDHFGGQFKDLREMSEKAGLKGKQKKETVLAILLMYKEAMDEFFNEMSSRVNRETE